MDWILSGIEARVLGCLIEKEITTPDYYPLTLNALVNACNQKSNRNPVMHLDEEAVVDALDSLRYGKHLVWQTTGTGSRVPKYKHDILEAFRFTPQELAVMCELMLRGPQTVGELRTHASRLVPFETLEAVDETLASLRDWDGRALVRELPREPGRREPRHMQLLCGEPVEEPCADPPGEPVRQILQSRDTRLAQLEQGVASLREEVQALAAQFVEFRRLVE